MICLGIDIGTTTLRASALDVRVGPHQREWKAIGAALCQLTPFIDANLDVEAIARALENWRVAQTLPEPDVGTILVTGEAQRAPNAVEAAEALRLRWPALLSAQLDPELETAVAAHGSGAVEFSRNSPGQSVLHLDIGGGTTNCAWLENGEIRDTACLDLGARKWVCDPENGQILHRTQAAVFLEKTLGRVNDFTLATAPRIAAHLAKLMLQRLWPVELSVLPWKTTRSAKPDQVFVSGGVAACLRESADDPLRYGDLGVYLAQALRAEAERLGAKLVISPADGCATAFGISAFGFEVSGVSVDARLPQAEWHLPLFEQAQLRARPPAARRWAVVLRNLPTTREGMESLTREWAEWLQRLPQPPALALFVMRENLAKTFGHYLRKALGANANYWAVLDELAIPEEATPGRTLDLKYLPQTNRYALSLKTLRLF